ncbi:hypothetical protein [Leucobacter iarius]|uniref:Major tail protein n=1 Tax=Leucobacter iarius TaxID=333963 RepID=A0ABN2LJK2_9MICO
MSRILGPGSLTVGAVGSPRQLAADLTKISLTPSTDSEDDIPLLDGSNESGADSTTWALSGTSLDQYTKDSLAQWAAENAGKELPFVFVPNADTGAEYGGVVKVRPIGLGGDVKKKNSNDFEWPLIGAPTWPTV